jgi:hypothetical protein
VSYIPLEQRVPVDHPLRALRAMIDEVLRELSPQFSQLYAKVGRPSIAPERLLRALLLQVLYSVRSALTREPMYGYDLARAVSRCYRDPPVARPRRPGALGVYTTRRCPVTRSGSARISSSSWRVT